MKAFVKVGLGVLAGGLVGAAAAFLGKKRNEDEDYITHEVETDDDSDSDEEAE